MGLARIFKPIRLAHAVAEPAADRAAGQTVDSGGSRVSRVEASTVTNALPSGPSPAQRASDEEGWLALLELVFDETGWPDA